MRARGQSHPCPLLPTGSGAVPERKAMTIGIISWIHLVGKLCCHHILKDFKIMLLDSLIHAAIN